MNSATLAYQAQLAGFRSSSRNAVPAAAPKPELELIFRRYEAVLRDIRERRLTLLTLYRRMLSSECPGYSAEGLATTITEFNRLAAGENSFLTSLHDAAGLWAANGVQQVQTFQ